MQTEGNRIIQAWVLEGKCQTETEANTYFSKSFPHRLDYNFIRCAPKHS